MKQTIKTLLAIDCFLLLFLGVLFIPTRPQLSPQVLVFPTIIPTPTPAYPLEFNHGSRQLPRLALTFDADMSPQMLNQLAKGKIKSWYNHEVIDVLRQEKIPSTLFISGLWAEVYPDITREISSDPLFEIGSHSYSHSRFTPACVALPDIPDWGKAGEFEKSQAILKKITGRDIRLFRFPGGCHDSEDSKLANSFGLTVVGWDVVSGDSFNNDLDSIIRNLKTKTKNGSVILFHLHGNQDALLTAPALKIIIPYFQSRGFTFVKLSDLF